MFDAAISTLVNEFGLLGVFLAAIIANATIFLPVPMDFVVLGIGSFGGINGSSIWSILPFGIVVGFGAAIGEMAGYVIGRLGLKALERAKKSYHDKMIEITTMLRDKGMVFIALCSFIPFPFDIVGMAAGIIKYNPVKFFTAVAVGKVARNVLIVLAGFYGLSIIKSFFMGG